MAGKPCAVWGCWHLAKYFYEGFWYCTHHARKVKEISMGDIYS